MHMVVEIDVIINNDPASLCRDIWPHRKADVSTATLHHMIDIHQRGLLLVVPVQILSCCGTCRSYFANTKLMYNISSSQVYIIHPRHAGILAHAY